MTTHPPTERVVHAERSGSLTHPDDFGPEHMRIVREAYAPGASETEFAVLWAGAKARGLDPVRKQIHFVCRFDKQKNRDVWSSQVSIDGFRSIAENTGKYDGQDEAEHEYDNDGRLILSRVRIYRKDIGRPIVGVARWNEYVQTAKGGEPSHMWQKMEHTMLDKCAEANGLRKAFPEPLAGLYVNEEMGQADNAAPVAAAWVRVDHPPTPKPLPPAHGQGQSRGLRDVIAEAAASVALDQPAIDLKESELRAYMASKGVAAETQRMALADFAAKVAARAEGEGIGTEARAGNGGGA